MVDLCLYIYIYTHPYDGFSLGFIWSDISHMYIYLSIYLSVCLSVYLSTCLSVYLSVYLSIPAGRTFAQDFIGGFVTLRLCSEDILDCFWVCPRLFQGLFRVTSLVLI